ncbi:MAG: Uncharacterized protein XD79_0356 [Atribacteria bacterium 34_128]|nr:MAG: Uncharacterized protein XD79_0356 [Atribacteria bacterium 34_128]
MRKIDFKKELKHLYNPPKEVVLVDVPEMNFLMIDGTGDPNTSPEYKDIWKWTAMIMQPECVTEELF